TPYKPRFHVRSFEREDGANYLVQIMYGRSVSIFALCFLSILSIVSFGCSSSGTEPAPPSEELRTVKDGLGREVELPPGVERAISLAPSITEMVFAAGAGDR